MPNTYQMKVDLKIKQTSVVPTFVQYDDARIEFQLFDGGKVFNIDSFIKAEVVHKRPDGQIILGEGSFVTNDKGVKVVRYDYLGNEMNQVGYAEASFSIYDDKNKKISIQSFRILIVDDLKNGLAATEEAGVLQTLIVDAENAIQFSSNATANAQELKFINAHQTTTQYKKNNTVSFNGESFIAKRDNIGKIPTGAPTDEDWAYMAKKGADGTGTVVRHKDTFIATANQTLFTLSKTYDQFQNRIDVTVGNVPQFSPANFIESSANTIQFTEGLPVGTEVIVSYFSEAQPLKTDLETVVNSHTTTLNDTNNLITEQTGKIATVTAQLADTVLLLSPIGAILNVANDGTQDISIPLREYAEGKDSIYLYFPPGNYRWDNNVRLLNKKIKLVGDNATIEHYATGTVLDIGDELIKKTEEASILGINFINKKPKPAIGGSGVSAIQIRDCVDLLIRDVVITDVEQYGINLRRSGGTIKNAVLDNVKVLKCSGTLSTTTSIALETRASSGDGKIESLKISNCYFEVTDSYINNQGTVTNVTLSNAAKLQACDAVDIVNTTFKGGKENGPLSFIFNTKKVSLTNVKLISDSTSSKGLTISNCPNLELSAVNSDLGVENFVQSIGINDSVKMVKLTNCRLQRIIGISGTPENFELNACNFFLPTTNLQIGVNNSVFNNCTIDRNSPMKGIVVSGNGNKFNNLNGAVVFEVTGNDNEITGGSCESIRPGATSKRGYVKGLKATSSDRPLRTLTETVEDWTFEDCVFERTVGGGTGHFVHLQGIRNKIIKSRFRQIDKSVSITYPIYVSNAMNCEINEKSSVFDVNKAATYNIKNEATSTNFKQYEVGDTFLNVGVPQMWNGTSFVAI